MEEKMPSPPSGDGKEDSQADASAISIATTSAALVLRSGTYLVQLPKDQIYRIPPPENAVIADSLRNHSFKRRKSCRFVLQWIIICVILVGVILTACSVVFSATLKPKNPTFRIEHFHLKNSSSSSSHHLGSMVEYDISMRSENPNVVWGVDYQDGGSALLSYHKKEIARGKPLAFSQGSKNTVTFRLVLDGSLRSAEHSLTSNAILKLSLTLPGRLKFVLLKAWSMNMSISCNLKVNSLAKGAKMLSQACQVVV
ncbi:hypothetical protein Syun_013633 [Stephania yunnanensis]|uniref:Late embryogenesis abundant protein LEA-2 subgroup domain-containing protein n=1 Tax=Stephania yunnanensis TaxID=152371 RepID=A0AAP0P7X6_9MAGN